MNTKEIGEIRRRQKRERSNMTAIYGCYVNDQKEIVSDFKRGTGIMSENEADKYFALLRRILGGTKSAALGKNLLEITFRTAQVADSPEHKLLMNLRGEALDNEENRQAFYQKVIESIDFEGNYLILLGTENYDVPFKSKDDAVQADNSAETYTYVLCAICPVKQTKAVLHYEPASKDFQDGNMVAAASAPVLGFLFPAFDQRATNIYNALYFTRSVKDNQEALVSALFNVPVDKPAEEQRASFTEMVADALGEECSMDVVQTVHSQICQQIAMHKESRVPDPLTISQQDIGRMLESCGVSKEGLEKFSTQYAEVFGEDTKLYPDNIIDKNKISVETPDVAIKVAAGQGHLLQTRVIGGIKYILIQADEDVVVNGINIQIGDKED